MQMKSLVAAIGIAWFAEAGLGSNPALAAPVPGGTLDPTTIPKYITPLVIPPVMKPSNAVGATPNDYEIAVRQFKQQILPSTNNITFPATTVWSYGPAQDTTPAVAPAADSQFNYPAYTIEATVNTRTNVNWINDLVANPDACKASADPANDTACNYLSHLLPIDRSLHWANPEQLACTDPGKTKDCRPDPALNGITLQQPYLGPVPIVTHVHGAHVGPESDGYPEAWWLPDANNIRANWARTGTLVNQYATLTNTVPGVGSFSYPNDQPSTTLWFHDHTLGMTRNNVYAGPAGFWLLREAGGGESGLVSGTLPGPAPVAGQGVLALNTPGNPVRAAIREIPIVIQDRSFNTDGSLFYPNQRAFFQELRYNQLNIPFIGDPNYPSDIPAMWNPEAFFNVMVVNGVSWPTLNVEPDRYRFRLLNGCNSRFLNLSMFVVDPATNQLTAQEVPFYQIGAEQGLLPAVVEVKTGFKTVLPGTGTIPAATAAATPEEALLMGLAERADVIVDFTGLASGTRVRLINTGPDSPFGGFPVAPIADPGTTGQVMEFVVTADTAAGESATAPASLKLTLPDAGDPANGPAIAGARDMALLEEESLSICVTVSPNGQINYDKHSTPDPNNPGTCLKAGNGNGTRNRNANSNIAHSVPMAPKAAVLGINGAAGGTVTLWSDPIQTNPTLGATETWELWNWSADAHPIHLHLVKFKLVNRQAFDPVTGSLTATRAPEPTEAGWKDTVIAYPGEVTRVNATFDVAGLYVWHCHIIEHEDNEMMVPFCVGDKAAAPGCVAVP